jgi:hypothetical protein
MHHLQQQEEQWMFVNAASITFGTTKHRLVPNAKQSLRLWLGPCRQTIAFVVTICLKILKALVNHAQHVQQIPISKWQQVQLQQNKKLAHVKKTISVNGVKSK